MEFMITAQPSPDHEGLLNEIVDLIEIARNNLYRHVATRWPLLPAIEKRNPLTLLVGMQTSTATMELRPL